MIKSIKKFLSQFTVSKRGSCFICDQIFKDNELNMHEELSFCDKDFQIFLEEKWITIEQKDSDPNNPENALYLTEVKAALAKHHIPSFIKTEYKESKLLIPERFELNFKEIVLIT